MQDSMSPSAAAREGDFALAWSAPHPERALDFPYDVVGLCNALMDTLVVVDDDALVGLPYHLGVMHLIGHDAWEKVFARYDGPGVQVASGGSGANTMAVLGLLGARARFRGQVGDDAWGRRYAESLQEACGGHALRFAPDLPTGKCLSLVSARNQERTMLVNLAAAPDLPDLGEAEALIPQGRVFYTTGYALQGGPIRDAALAGIRVARAAGVRVAVDVADPFVVHGMRDDLLGLLKEQVDLVFMNEEEAQALCPGRTAEEAALDVAAFVETVVVKLGSRGSLAVCDGRVVRAGIHRVQAVDTTGAGDSYAAGFLYGFVNGWPLEQCTALGARVAALTVAQLGAVCRDRAGLAAAVEAVRCEGGRT